MTGLAVQRCPTCEFRFSSRTGLDYHLSVDHPVPPPMARADRPCVSNAVASAHVARDRRGVAKRRPHAVGVVLAFAALLLVGLRRGVSVDVGDGGHLPRRDGSARNLPTTLTQLATIAAPLKRRVDHAHGHPQEGADRCGHGFDARGAATASRASTPCWLTLTPTPMMRRSSGSMDFASTLPRRTPSVSIRLRRRCGQSSRLIGIVFDCSEVAAAATQESSHVVAARLSTSLTLSGWREPAAHHVLIARPRG